jgi:hypothetical protein
MNITPSEYIRHANGVFIVEKFEDDSVTAVKLDDLLRQGTKARKVEFRNGSSILAQAEAYGQPLNFEAGALIRVTTRDAIHIHIVNVIPHPGTEAEASYKHALALLFAPAGLAGSFGI